jgi:hypothetical protein
VDRAFATKCGTRAGKSSAHLHAGPREGEPGAYRTPHARLLARRVAPTATRQRLPSLPCQIANIRYLWPGQAEAPVGVNSSWFLAEAARARGRLENSLLRALSHRPELESGRTQGNLACLLQSKRLIINATQSRNPNRGFQPASPLTSKYHSPGGPGPARVEKMDKEAPAIAE